ncbi:nucleoside kinase [Anaerococcus sp. AGMB00486]|uniref:Nucleoside kinase n=2 Tax=Anaerococcus TaxID=165779 RepID=A0ABX2N7I7_9FIRM|nr:MULTISPECIES: nucleoside kinase [Anaerococcus]MSS76860.1 nucleoside kinase [Anaerococcus porci]NVF10656.1 nucleoside kinase [Anaerococcus faecalis]
MKVILDNNSIYTNKIYLFELVKELFPKSFRDYIIALVNEKIVDFNYKLRQDDDILLIKKDMPLAYSVYESTLTMLLIDALKSIYNQTVVVEYSMSNCLYVRLEDKAISHEYISLLYNIIRNNIDKDISIVRKSVTKEIAIDIFRKQGDYSKIDLMKSIDKNKVDLYEFNGWFYNFSNLLLAKTSWIEEFEIISYYPGIMLNFKKINGILNKFSEEVKLTRVYEQSKKWTKLLDINYASDLNKLVIDNKISTLIKVNEAYYNNQLADCAYDIIRSDMNIVMLAGPSSSGKTTTAKKLAIQLAVYGKNAYVISTDDYFLDRDNTPLDKYGNKDFESLNAIDLKAFNRDLQDLIEGKELKLPSYNFTKGIREMSDKKIKLDKKTVLIVEGIHALNPSLTSLIPEKNKYKVYVSVLSQINIEPHVRISSSENRLIRRIVRDNKFRSYDTEATLKVWSNVRRGEENYIFPYQNTADFYVDSSLLYEFNALKSYAIDALDQIKKDSDYYYMALKLRKVLSYFKSIEDTKIIADDSILREFIGDEND